MNACLNLGLDTFVCIGYIFQSCLVELLKAYRIDKSSEIDRISNIVSLCCEVILYGKLPSITFVSLSLPPSPSK